MADFTSIKDGLQRDWEETRALASGLGSASAEEHVLLLQTRVKESAEELGRLAGEADKAAPGAGGPSKADVLALQAEAESLAALLGALQTTHSAFKDNRKTHFLEAGSWGRHYSTVRMTVLTFTLTTCSVLLALKLDTWKERIWPISGLWLIGVMTFWVFTYQTYDRLGSQLRYRPRLPADTGERPREVSFDWASLVVPIVNIGVMLLACGGGFPTSCLWKTVWGIFIAVSVLVPMAIRGRVRGKKWFSLRCVLWIVVGVAVVFGLMAGVRRLRAPGCPPAGECCEQPAAPAKGAEK